ncbi:ABC transporter ATP-binding protein [Fimbriiglobus ruber]|uniref:ABC transporter, ATP-binding protein n=1 Tax=Fimbriiglobus ruber TaxID=1908690 RepID=A0A225DHB6_9BACT|nr:ABC transporter ATP-binding protein [Fimbriiglobus ruber]OWK40822.1 ABC transporter, ATP-binding protein [Fimbriiglobus ruber]
MTAAATFEKVEKVYKTGPFGRAGVPAVRGVTLSVPAGSVFGLLGPNRAGKTTLVKLLLSLAWPTSGTVTRLGGPTSARASLGRVGYMHENHAFPRYLSASEVLRFYGGLTGVPSADLGTRANHLLERVGLADRGREPITRFSKGMVQRLGLAQALMNDPDLLVLDEPTEGLDLAGRQLLRDVVGEFRQAGKTVLVVTHVLNEVEEICDELAVLVAGKLAYRGRLADLLATGSGEKKPLEHALRGLYQKGAAE